ncbi:hypothetical protein DL93DRAFT_2125688 [Clavulina sp. PMI_390]|nr:hypothetical protein DL93DRAFT_2125688 [Clavulina sp. PMI_390]
MSNDTQTAQIHSWQSIVTLIVFLVTNLVVVFPFKVPIPLPQGTRPAFRRFLVKLRILPKDPIRENPYLDDEDQPSPPTQLYFPFNFVTMPPISVIFLTCLKVISREEYHDGIIGSNNIIPIDIMAFFLTLAYVAISIDATGLIRSLAFWVAKTYGGLGHRLYFLLYLFFFGLGSFIGNDPIILSGTAFMAYLTRVSANIKHPRAWIYAQFAVANISSAILVSSNPTNLVLSGAFRLRFLDYTINMIIPVIVTAAVLFPFLLYIIFFSVDLIPYHIDVHSLIDNEDSNPALSEAEREHRKELREIMNPLIDRGGAIFGGALMAITLTTLLATNAAGLHPGVYTMTVPAAAIMFTRDLWYDWGRRGKTREMAREKREKKIEKLKARAQSAGEERLVQRPLLWRPPAQLESRAGIRSLIGGDRQSESSLERHAPLANGHSEENANGDAEKVEDAELANGHGPESPIDSEKPATPIEKSKKKRPWTLYKLWRAIRKYAKETFPTVSAVLEHLPFALVPFAFSMFILVQALVTKGWVNVFANGWHAWITKTGTVGGIGGMGFVSVLLCNFAGTNIGTSILLSRVLQFWLNNPNNLISDRDRDASIYALALGVNYGAFSAAFNASLAGLLWRDILARKHIHVQRLEFARINLPIIAIAMSVGCAVLTGQVYLIKDDTPRHQSTY